MVTGRIEPCITCTGSSHDWHFTPVLEHEVTRSVGTDPDGMLVCWMVSNLYSIVFSWWVIKKKLYWKLIMINK